MFAEVDVRVAALPVRNGISGLEGWNVWERTGLPCESVRRVNEHDRTGERHWRRVSGRKDRDVQLLPDCQRFVRIDRFNGLEERRPFRECRKIRDDAVDDVGRGGDGRGCVYDAIGGVRVVCHGGGHSYWCWGEHCLCSLVLEYISMKRDKHDGRMIKLEAARHVIFWPRNCRLSQGNSKRRQTVHGMSVFMQCCSSGTSHHRQSSTEFVVRNLVQNLNRD